MVVQEPFLALSSVSKTYGGTRALREVDINIRAGEVHALIGENGAGKSTLGNVLTGRVQPDRGTIRVAGAIQQFSSPRIALSLGCASIAQELAIMPNRSVVDNVMCGVESRRLGVVRRRVQLTRFGELAARVGLDVAPDTRVGDLSIVDQQRVEILRALSRNARLIVFDEPTARLPSHEADSVTSLMRVLADSGCAVVFVSHFLGEVLAIADVVTVMRDGSIVRRTTPGVETSRSLVTTMLGRTLEHNFPERTPPADDASVVMSVQGIDRSPKVQDVSFEIHAGEVLGLAGLVGSGRSELARCLIGADRRRRGSVFVRGARVVPRVRTAAQAGLVMIPESRKAQGLQMNRSTSENISLLHLSRLSRFGVVRRRAERRAVEEMALAVGIPVDKLEDPVRNLSGGNQQKVLFARNLLHEPTVMIVDEPTRGVDVGAKRAIYEVIEQKARGGMAVLLISSEMEEMLQLPHRVIVLHRGRAVATLERESITEERILMAAFGSKGRSA